MSKKILFPMIIVLVLLASVYVYWNFFKNTIVPISVELSNPINVEKNDDTSTIKGNKSLRNLLTSNDSLKCTYNNIEDNIQSRGIYYLDGKTKRIRVESIVEIENKEIKTFFLTLGDASYSWTDDGISKTGLKFSNQSTNLENNLEIPENETSLIPKDAIMDNTNPDIDLVMDKEVGVDCQKWIIDESMFILPSDVFFQDMTNLTKQLENINTNPNIDIDLNKIDPEILKNLPLEETI